jgi:hypothetical protein
MYQDAIRGELYRDFADPIGMASRTLVEGLYGIQPDALAGVLTIQPGFPSKWDNASLDIPDISFSFKRANKKDVYHIENHFASKMDLNLVLNAPFSGIESISSNGKTVQWETIKESIGTPKISLKLPYATVYDIVINWKGGTLEKMKPKAFYTSGEPLNMIVFKSKIVSVYDPQSILGEITKTDGTLQSTIKGEGNKMFFVKLKQDNFEWWNPVEVVLKPKIETKAQLAENNNLEISIKNNSVKKIEGGLILDASEKGKPENIILDIYEKKAIQISVADLMPGTNTVSIKTNSGAIEQATFINWDIPLKASSKLETVSLSSFFNAKVIDIFNVEYLSPRPKTATLQLPKQGIGNWCYPNVAVKIDDKGLREMAKNNDQFETPLGISFKTPSNENQKNIVFTSMWDNYPDFVTIPLNGKASHAYFMVAGSTNPMQSRMVNGEIKVEYTDGTFDVLQLKNPENWWPIEQDYFTDGLAFTTDAPKPPRVYLKSGEVSRTFKNFTNIKGYSSYGIDGGAATILDLPLNKNKTLKNLTLKTIANDVVIGLMSMTLIR